MSILNNNSVTPSEFENIIIDLNALSKNAILHFLEIDLMKPIKPSDFKLTFTKDDTHKK